MEIVAIRYADADQSQVLVDTDDGKQRNAPWPCQTGWLDELIQAWIRDGRQVGAFAPPTLSRDELLTALHMERSRRRYPGRLATGLGFDADLRDAEDFTNLHGLGAQGTALKSLGETAAAIWFRCADNRDHMLTPEEAIRIGLRLGRYVAEVYVASDPIRQRIVAGALATREQIAAAAEWPDPQVAAS